MYVYDDSAVMMIAESNNCRADTNCTTCRRTREGGIKKDTMISVDCEPTSGERYDGAPDWAVSGCGACPRFRRSSAITSMLLRLFSRTGFVRTLYKGSTIRHNLERERKVRTDPPPLLDTLADLSTRHSLNDEGEQRSQQHKNGQTHQ